MTWAILLLGWSGLVIGVGWENDGLVRSTRLSAGATRRHPLPLSGLMQLGPAAIVAGVGLLELGGALQAPVTTATARPMVSNAADRAGSAPQRIANPFVAGPDRPMRWTHPVSLSETR